MLTLLALLLTLVPRAHAVYGGQAADTRAFQFVRYLDVEFPNGRGGCTGTQLERGIVLTAAHCVINKDNKRARKITVKRRPSDRGGLEAHSANVHALYRYDGTFLNDIAVLYTFDESTSYATIPIDYAWSRYKATNRDAYYPAFLTRLTVDHLRDIFAKSIPRDPEGNLWAYIVGFGLQCPEEKCPSLPNAARYVGKPIYASDRGTNTCVRAPFNFKTAPQRFCAFTEDASITRSSANDGKSNANFGDSGGPMFSFDASGTAVVIGIVNSGTREYGFFTSVYDQVDFLRYSLNSPGHKNVRFVMFGPGSYDTAEAKPEDSGGLKEVTPLLKSMLEKYSHDVSGLRMGSATHEMWADEVMFEGKPMRRDQVRDRLDAVSKKWPQRAYRLQRVRRASSCAGEECTVVAEVVWQHYRGEKVEGMGSIYTWVMRREAGAWRIVSQTSKQMFEEEKY